MCGVTWEMRSCTGRVRCLSNLRYWFADQSCEAVDEGRDDMVRCDNLMLVIEDRVQLTLRRDGAIRSMSDSCSANIGIQCSR
jgi:hypothetical protein